MTRALLLSAFLAAAVAGRGDAGPRVAAAGDRDGRVMSDSTRVDEPSGYPALDTAALAGAPALRFVPAKAHGEAIPVSMLFPVFFRHPEARPLPGDSVLRDQSRRADPS